MQVDVNVVDIQDRTITIEVDDNMSNEEIEKHIKEGFFTNGLAVVADEDYDCSTELRSFIPPGVDEDGDPHERIDLE